MSNEHLRHYQNALTRLNNNGSFGRVETTISFSIYDQISRVSVLFPKNCFEKPGEKIELLHISSVIEGDERPVEITNLTGSCSETYLQFVKNGNAVQIEATVCQKACSEGIRVEFEVWEIVTPLKGATPYDRAELRLKMSFGEALDQGEHILLLDYPKSQTPRSTQGTHDFAYPSRTKDSRRVQPLYFHRRKSVELSLTVGNNDGLAIPWVSLFKTAVSAFFVSAVASQINDNSADIKFFLGLLAAFAAATSVIWDIVVSIGNIQLYQGRRQKLTFLILALQFMLLAGIATIILNVVGIKLVGLDVLLWAVTGIGISILGAAAIGYTALLSGWLHGYRCDHVGCKNDFRWLRLSANECYYTGRVFCSQHVRDVCEGCVHHKDLGSPIARTSEEYSFDSPACVRELG